MTVVPPGEFRPVTLPDGRVLTSGAVSSGLEVLARGFETQGKTAEAAAVRAMDAQGGIAKIPTDTVPAGSAALSLTSAAPAGGLMTPAALAVGGFFIGGPVGAVIGGAAGFFLSRR
jgi:hypothetical protein